MIDQPMVPASEYDALCELFRGICDCYMADESDVRRQLSVDFDNNAVEWAVEILNGATSRELFEALDQEKSQ